MAVFGGSVRFSGERPTPCETFHLKHERRDVPSQAVTIVGCCRGPFRGVHRHIIALCWRFFFFGPLICKHVPMQKRECKLAPERFARSPFHEMFCTTKHTRACAALSNVNSGLTGTPTKQFSSGLAKRGFENPVPRTRNVRVIIVGPRKGRPAL